MSLSSQDWVDMSLHISTHFICIVTFVTCFYFLYIFHEEGRVMVKQLDQIALVILSPFAETLRQDLYRAHAGEYFRLWIQDNDNRLTWERFMSRLEAIHDNIDKMAEAAQRNIRRKYKKTMAVSFSVIGMLVIIAIMWNAYLFRRFPKIRIKWQKLAISIGISCMLIFTTEIMFFLLITRRLNATSPELLVREFLRGTGDIVRYEWRNLMFTFPPSRTI